MNAEKLIVDSLNRLHGKVDALSERVTRVEIKAAVIAATISVSAGVSVFLLRFVGVC